MSVTRAAQDKHFKKGNKFLLIHRNWHEGLHAEYIREEVRPETSGFQYNNIHASYDQIAIQYPDYKYFTVIRDPLTRWESLYKHACDHNFIIDWDIVTWTKKAISSIENGSVYGTIQNVEYFEKSLTRMGSYHVMYLPAWTFYREPEVEVHKLENQTIWKAMDLMKNNHHKSITEIAGYDREYVFKLIYDYYKRDFERWQMTE